MGKGEGRQCYAWSGRTDGSWVWGEGCSISPFLSLLKSFLVPGRPDPRDLLFPVSSTSLYFCRNGWRRQVCHSLKLRLKTQLSFRGNLATIMSLWPNGIQRLGHHQVRHPFILSKYSFVSAVVEPRMQCISVLWYIFWLLIEIGLQGVQHNVVPAMQTCILKYNETVLTWINIWHKMRRATNQRHKRSVQKQITTYYKLLFLRFIVISVF